MRTQVGIVGAGPAGLLLSHLLHRAGIDCVVLEARSRDYVESRVRAGVLEQGTVALIARARRRRAAAPRGHARSTALDIRFDGGAIHIDLAELTGGQGRHRLRPAGGGEGPDRGAARARRPILFEAEAVGHRRARPATGRRSASGTTARTRARLRLRRRLRRLPRHLPRRDPGERAHRLRPRSIRSAGSASWPNRRRHPTS